MKYDISSLAIKVAKSDKYVILLINHDGIFNSKIGLKTEETQFKINKQFLDERNLLTIYYGQVNSPIDYGIMTSKA